MTTRTGKERREELKGDRIAWKIREKRINAYLRETLATPATSSSTGRGNIVSSDTRTFFFVDDRVFDNVRILFVNMHVQGTYRVYSTCIFSRCFQMCKWLFFHAGFFFNAEPVSLKSIIDILMADGTES